MPQYNPLVDNQVFISQIGYLALIGLKGPLRATHLNEFINNVRVLDKPEDIVVGDLAYTGNKKGVVTGVSVAGALVTITAKYGPLDRPAGVTSEEWSTNYATLAFETKQHVIKKTTSGASPTTNDKIINPWLVLANVGAVFARPVDSIVNTSENDDIILLTQNISIVQGGPATSLKFNLAGVTVQKKVNGVNSGAAVVANSLGVVSMPNGNTAGQFITFLVTKAGLNDQTFGVYTVAAA